MTVAVADVVAVEPAVPTREQPHSIRPGVDLQKSFHLWVGFRLERPPVISSAVGRWTAPEREFGYWLVGLLVAAKGLPLVGSQTGDTEDAPGLVKRWYRQLRATLAARLLLPRYEPSASEPTEDWEGTAPGFEASRRVIEFTGDDKFRLICHVFAPRVEGATDRLLSQFLDTFSAERREWEFCDGASRLCLLGRSSFRLPHRQYWEIVIAPSEHLEVEGEALAANEVYSEMDKIGSALLDEASLAEVDARSDLDWNFISAEIDRALEAGVDLDDEFVERLARKRFENAKELLAVERPGPTLESSREIAREVVAIYQLGLGRGGRA